MTDMKHDFFISYASEDREWADWINWVLLTAGYTTYLDKERLNPGNRIITEITSAVASSQRCLALLSSRYHSSEWTKYEYHIALGKSPQNPEGRLVPIMVEDHPVPEDSWFCGTNYVKLAGQFEERAKEELLSRLGLHEKPGAAVPNSSEPPPFPGQKTREHPSTATSRSATLKRQEWKRELRQRIAALEAARDRASEAGEDLRHYEELLARLNYELENGYPLEKGDLFCDDRFRLEKQIGEGLYGTVWSALDRQTSKRVALKILREIHHDRSEARTRFTGSAKMLQHMQHPGILRIHAGPIEEDPFCFLVLDLIEGRNLQEEVEWFHSRGRIMPWERAQRISANIAAILAHLHDQEGVAHLDVRPNKILIGPGDQLRLTGFEQARRLQELGPSRFPPLILPRSPRAPDWDQAYLGQETDVWYLGQLTLRLLAISDARGDVPGDVGEGLKCGLRDPAALIAESQLPHATKELLERAVHEVRSDRLPTVGEFLSVFAPEVPTAVAEILRGHDPSSFSEMSQQDKARLFDDLIHAISTKQSIHVERPALLSQTLSYELSSDYSDQPWQKERLLELVGAAGDDFLGFLNIAKTPSDKILSRLLGIQRERVEKHFYISRNFISASSQRCDHPEEPWLPDDGAHEIHYTLALIRRFQDSEIFIVVCAHPEEREDLVKARIRTLMWLTQQPESIGAMASPRLSRPNRVLEGVWDRQSTGNSVTKRFQWLGRFGFAVFGADAVKSDGCKNKNSWVTLLLNGIPLARMHFSLPWARMAKLKSAEIQLVDNVVRPYAVVKLGYINDEEALVEEILGGVRGYLPQTRFDDPAVDGGTRIATNSSEDGETGCCFFWSRDAANSTELRNEIEKAIAVLGRENVFPVVIEENAPVLPVGLQ